MKKSKKILIIVGTVILILAAAFILYVNDYYHADSKAQADLESSDKIKVSRESFGYFFDGIGTNDAMIFYPGAKVEVTAYAPLMRELSGTGIDCFLVKMPCNFAFLGINKADEIMKKYNYENWYLSGHSLGGAMAAKYAVTSDRMSGLILLGAYPAKHFQKDDIKLLSFYGSEDRVLNKDEYDEGRQYWPANSEEIVINGGNHAYYGNYGSQYGDGDATISREEQQRIVVKKIVEFIR